MKRRTLVHVAIAAPLAGFIHRYALPGADAPPLPSGLWQGPSAAATPHEETPVMQWFRRWQEATTALNTQDMTEDEFERMNEDRIAIEDSLMAIPAESARDFVAKVYAYTNRGEVGLPSHIEAPALWDEARALVFDAGAIFHGEPHPQEGRA